MKIRQMPLNSEKNMSLTHDVNEIRCVQRVSIAEFLTEQIIEYSDVLSFRLTPELNARIHIKAKMLRMKPSEYLRQQMNEATCDVEYTS